MRAVSAGKEQLCERSHDQRDVPGLCCQQLCEQPRKLSVLAVSTGDELSGGVRVLHNLRGRTSAVGGSVCRLFGGNVRALWCEYLHQL